MAKTAQDKMIIKAAEKAAEKAAKEAEREEKRAAKEAQKRGKPVRKEGRNAKEAETAEKKEDQFADFLSCGDNDIPVKGEDGDSESELDIEKELEAQIDEEADARVKTDNDGFEQAVEAKLNGASAPELDGASEPSSAAAAPAPEGASLNVPKAIAVEVEIPHWAGRRISVDCSSVDGLKEGRRLLGVCRSRLHDIGINPERKIPKKYTRQTEDMALKKSFDLLAKAVEEGCALHGRKRLQKAVTVSSSVHERNVDMGADLRRMAQKLEKRSMVGLAADKLAVGLASPSEAAKVEKCFERLQADDANGKNEKKATQSRKRPEASASSGAGSIRKYFKTEAKEVSVEYF